MTANTTGQIARLRAQIADVLERHRKVKSFALPQPEFMCTECKRLGHWPCDAADLARQMTTLLDGLEEIGRLPVFHDEDGLTIDIAVRAHEAIAAAAQEGEDST